MPHDTDPDRDREIRSFFEEVHRQQTPPPFRSLWRAPRPRRERWALVPRFAVAALLAAVAIWVLLRTAGGPGAPPPGDVAPQVVAADTLTGWRGPLDFLLRTPGREILESAPSFLLETPAVPIETDHETERRSDNET